MQVLTGTTNEEMTIINPVRQNVFCQVWVCLTPVIWIGILFLKNSQNYLGAAFQRVAKSEVLLKYLVKTKGQDDVKIRTDIFLVHPAM